MNKDEQRVYENLKKRFQEFQTVADGDKKSRQKLGQYFTPFDLCWKMVQKFAAESLRDATKTCLDPTCGYGNLLITLMMRKISLGCDPTLVFVNTYGNELDPSVLAVCKDNLRKFAKMYNISDVITEFVLDTHFHIGNALEDSAYRYTDEVVWWVRAHSDRLGIAIDLDNGRILAVEEK